MNCSSGILIYIFSFIQCLPDVAAIVKTVPPSMQGDWSVQALHDFTAGDREICDCRGTKGAQ